MSAFFLWFHTPRRLLCALLLAAMVHAAERSPVTYTLDIATTTLTPAGTSQEAMTINGGIPGPVLRFREGDMADILVRNRLTDEDTSIHWHGLLVPNSEDGVPYTTTPPIPPGQERRFRFRLTHAGTYWYHSHTGLQEQRGVYGAIVIEPAKPTIPVERDEVLVLSDWTDESPTEVMRTLMRGSDWYAIRKGTAQSIFGAAQAGHLGDYLVRERARLPPMDVSDVAYDAFLVNGKRQVDLPAKPGDRVRLRIINAGASTYFYLHSASGPLTIISADGNDVQPIQQQRLLIGMAETYDLLYTVPASGSWELRATAQDGSGHASAYIGSGAGLDVEPMAPINPYSMSQSMAAILDQLDESGSLSDAQALAAESPRPLPPYKRLRALRPTALPTDAPVRTLDLHLTGDMVRYIWSINGKTIGEDSTIPVRRGEILRLVLINDTMMHHPMHLHGHFFRLLMSGGPSPDHAPLKHTVDVPPMSRRTIEFLANEDKDWLFHCHLLYHHKNGMARVFSYDDQGPDHQPQHEDGDVFYPMLDATLLSNLTYGRLALMNQRNDLALSWDAGWGKPSDLDDADYDVDATWLRYWNARWSTFVGLRGTNQVHGDRDSLFGSRDAAVDLGNDAEVVAIAGVIHRLPYNIDTTFSVTSAGDARLGVAKSLQLTDRLSVPWRIEYDTAQDAMAMAGLSYTISKSVSAVVLYDTDDRLGAGVALRF